MRFFCAALGILFSASCNVSGLPFFPGAFQVTTSSLPNATAGTAYNPPALRAFNGLLPFTWSSPDLPAWLTLSSSGQLGGTAPSANGMYSFIVVVTDSSIPARTAQKILAVTVTAGTAGAPSIATTSLLPWTVGAPHDQGLSASGGVLPYVSWAESGALPTGLSFNTSTGTFSGTPTATGSFPVTVTVTDSTPATSAPQALTVLVNPALMITTATPLAPTTSGVGYETTLTFSGGTAPVTWSSANLPGWLTLTTGGFLAGTAPRVVGPTTYSFPVTATDSAGGAATKTLSLLVNPPVAITTSDVLPTGTQGSGYGPVTLLASGGTSPMTWSADGTLNGTGLSLSAAGAVSGTITVPGNITFTATATDSVGATAQKVFTIPVTPSSLQIRTTLLPDGTATNLYSATVTAIGGSPPYTWTFTTLPAWATGVSGTQGVITGTPPSAGPASVTLTVSDGVSPPQTATFPFTIFAPAATQGSLSVATTRLPDASTGVLYTGTVAAYGGSGSGYTFTALTSPPAGLTLAATGVLGGTPTTAGDYTFAVDLTDSGLNAARANVRIVVGPPGALAITTVALPTVTYSVEMTPFALAASGGEPPYIWDLGGTDLNVLPMGLVLTRDGVLYGIPKQTGIYSVPIHVRDSGKARREAVTTFSLTVSSGGGFQITTTSLPGAAVGTAYSQSIAANQTASVWTADDKALVLLGLALNRATGAVTGTPTASGQADLLVLAANTASPRASTLARISLAVAQTPGVTTTSMPDGTIGTAYSFTLAHTSVGVSWSVLPAGDPLPAGLTLAPTTGVVSGTPSGLPGTSVLLVTDGAVGVQGVVTISIRGPDPAISRVFPPSSDQAVFITGNQGASYQFHAALEGNVTGDLPTMDLFAGRLPPGGLALDTLGRIFVGTPANPGRYVLPVRITDRSVAGATNETAKIWEDSGILEILQAPGFRITTRNLVPGRQGVAYQASPLCEGQTSGSPSWSVAAGSLPPGLSLDPNNGTITGTPIEAGIFSFVLRASWGPATATMAFDLPVDPTSGFGIATARLTNGVMGAFDNVPYQGQLATYGGAATSWSDAGSPVTFGSLGLILNTLTGAITGNPAQSGSFTIRVTATNGVTTSIRDVAMLISPLAITAAWVANAGFDGTGYFGRVQAFGGVPIYGYALEDGEILPPSNPSLLMFLDGTFSGTPTVSSNLSSFLVLLADSAGNFGVGKFSWFIFPPDLPALGFVSAPGRWQTQGLVPFSRTVAAQGGTLPYTFSETPASLEPADVMLPPGITAGATGTVSGTATTTGFFRSMLRVTDNVSKTSDMLIGRFSVFCPTAPGTRCVQTRRIPDGISGIPYSGAFVDAMGPLGWTSVSAVAIPPGLSVSLVNGVPFISGTPIMPGIYVFTIMVSDGVGSATGFMKFVAPQ